MAATKPQSTPEEIRESVGDLSKVEVFHNYVLVGLYLRPEDYKTPGGIIIPDKTRDEDRWQGKVGLVLKKGPLAFKADGVTEFGGVDIAEGDWVFFRVSDGFPHGLNGAHCRLLEDTHIKGRVSDPGMIY